MLLAAADAVGGVEAETGGTKLTQTFSNEVEPVSNYLREGDRHILL